MSQPQRETVTVSEFLQSAQEERAKHPSGTVLCYKYLKIVNDKDSGSEQQLLDLRGLHLSYVDFRGLKATRALFRETGAYRCDFTGSNWSGAQGNFQICSSNVSEANFTGAERFSFYDSYALRGCFPQGLNAEQTKSIIPVSNETRWLLGTCNTEHFNYIIEQEKRISGLEATVAALAAQVEQLSQRQQ